MFYFEWKWLGSNLRDYFPTTLWIKIVGNTLLSIENHCCKLQFNLLNLRFFLKRVNEWLNFKEKPTMIYMWYFQFMYILKNKYVYIGSQNTCFWTHTLAYFVCNNFPHRSTTTTFTCAQNPSTYICICFGDNRTLYKLYKFKIKRFPYTIKTFFFFSVSFSSREMFFEVSRHQNFKISGCDGLLLLDIIWFLFQSWNLYSRYYALDSI